jgi:hypothetical protein
LIQTKQKIKTKSAFEKNSAKLCEKGLRVTEIAEKKHEFTVSVYERARAIKTELMRQCEHTTTI